MRLLLVLVAALSISASWSTVHAQNGEKSAPSLMGSNSEGFRFMVAFMQNEVEWCRPGGTDLRILVGSRFTTRFQVRFQEGYTVDTIVQAFHVVQIGVPLSYEMIGEGVFQHGIEIVSSDKPITVTVYNGKSTTSDGYLAIPVNSWGTQYVSACYYVDQYREGARILDCYQTPRPGEFAVIASEDSTIVNVAPSTQTLGNVRYGQIARVMLHKGQIYQVQDGGEQMRSIRNQIVGTDLTGSVITSNKPVGLLSGHVRTSIANEHWSADHLVEMLPPRNALGKRYMVVPFGDRIGGDIVRIVSTVGFLTRVTISSGVKGDETVLLRNTGDFADYDIVDPIVITSDQPLLVTHYSRSQDAARLPDSSFYSFFDPDMVVVTPEEQFVNGAVFQTLSNDSAMVWADNRLQLYTKFRKHFVALVGERETFDATLLNGRRIAAHTVLDRGVFASTGFAWAIIEVPHDQTHIIESEGKFGGYVYGVGAVDSYAWPIGSGLRQFDIVDRDPPVLSARSLCGTSEIIAVDSGRSQLGLNDFWMDTAASVNATFTKTFVIIGDELSLGYVRAKDPRQPAFARIWAEDLAGQRTSIDVVVSTSIPSFSHDTISMGYVQVGRTYSRPFTITNSGPSQLHVDSIYLKRGREFTLDKRYRDITVAPDGGMLTANVLYMTLTKATSYDTLCVVADCQEYLFPLVAHAAAPQITTTGWDFGRVRVGRAPTRRIVVGNPGDAPLRVDSAVIEGASFTIVNELQWPVIIQPGRDTVALDVVFTPSATKQFTGVVRFYSDVVDSVALAPLVGVGIYPSLVIGGHNYGRVQLGDTACALVPIVNIGSDTAFLRELTLPDPQTFIADQSVFNNPRQPGGAYPLAPGDTLWVPVCFAPLAEREYFNDISPRNDDDLTATNTLTGSGYRLRATIGGADMGRRWVGSPKDSTVYVTNVGTDPITITRIYLGGGDVGDFRIDTLDQEITLAPGARHPIPLVFNPLVAGHREASIHATTTSRHQPQLDSVLIGFGLVAMSSDTLLFNDSIAYSCEDRGGTVVIVNEGNTPLTIASITYASQPPIMTLNAPEPGYTIAVGESLELNFALAFNGYQGVTSGSVSWTFEEPPNASQRREYTRDFTIVSTPQAYTASATTPGEVLSGVTYNIAVRIDTALRVDVVERELRIDVEFDPTMSWFDAASWIPGTVVGPWRLGDAIPGAPGNIALTIHAAGAPFPISGVALPPLPFKAFVGERERDTLRITLKAVGNDCAPLFATSASVSLDSICGLSERLFQYTGSPFNLLQNRPNPTDDKTEISFTLSIEAHTQLAIFDAEGRLVATLIDRVLPAGDYAIPLDVAKFPTGAYFYRLTSGSFSATRRMQIAR